MEIKTFRASTMQDALNLVRSELGPEATVLHTRELNTGLVGRMFRRRQYEIAASVDIAVPARSSHAVSESTPSPVHTTPEPTHELDYRTRYRNHFHQESQQGLDELHELADQLRERTPLARNRQLPETLFRVYTDMIEADIEEAISQELVEKLRHEPQLNTESPTAARDALERMLAAELNVTGPIEARAEQGKVVALVGPTGVGKTTTIAKLAANYRLRENKRVGLITVDTYRIAAVEQLRTYADIIDLPMEIVSTPREMRDAITRMSDLDLLLMDTAGRSPRDEVRIQELKSMLTEAEPDEVHLVLSAVGSARSLVSTAQRFATVGTTALLVTKLDEATTLGNLLSVTRNSQLPISYLTDGQNVPDDIQVAKSPALASMILEKH